MDEAKVEPEVVAIAIAIIWLKDKLNIEGSIPDDVKAIFRTELKSPIALCCYLMEQEKISYQDIYEVLDESVTISQELFDWSLGNPAQMSPLDLLFRNLVDPL